MNKDLLPVDLSSLADVMSIPKEKLKKFPISKTILQLFREYNDDQRSIVLLRREISSLYFTYSDSTWSNAMSRVIDYLDGYK